MYVTLTPWPLDHTTIYRQCNLYLFCRGVACKYFRAFGTRTCVTHAGAFACPNCTGVWASRIGLYSHQRACKNCIPPFQNHRLRGIHHHHHHNCSCRCYQHRRCWRLLVQARLQKIFEPRNTIYSQLIICSADPPSKKS